MSDLTEQGQPRVCGKGTEEGYIDRDGHVRPACSWCIETNLKLIGATIVPLKKTGICKMVVRE